jgi:hypothetical protein
MTFSKLLYRCFKHRWERALAVLSVVVGALALLIGWLGISRATLTTEQLPYLASGGLLGLFALGLGATLWLSADLRDEFGALLRIKDLMEDGADPPAEPVVRLERNDGPVPAQAVGSLTAGSGGKR